jgi:hypothetical protein
MPRCSREWRLPRCWLDGRAGSKLGCGDDERRRAVALVAWRDSTTARAERGEARRSPGHQRQLRFHRDELYYIASGQHPALGYVDYPPVTPLLARLDTSLFGTSPAALRVVPAVVGALLVVLTGLCAREMGGGHGTQALAAFVAVVCPLLLGANWLFQTVTFDQLTWLIAMYLVLRLLKSNSASVWVALGLDLGIGFETKFTILALCAGIVAATLSSADLRSRLRTRWPWIGHRRRRGACPAQPCVAGRQRLSDSDVHQQPQRGHLPEWRHPDIPRQLSPLHRARGAAALDRRLVRAVPRRTSTPDCADGAGRHPRPPPRRQGGVPGPDHPRRSRRGLRRCGQDPRPPVASPHGGSRRRCLANRDGAADRIGVPLVATASLHSAGLDKLRQDFADTVGWPELTSQVDAAFNALPAAQRAATVILAANYGEAGAIDVYGRAGGTVQVLSPQLSFWYWKPAQVTAATVLTVGYAPGDIAFLCGNVAQLGAVVIPYSVTNQEHGTPILLCTHLREPLDQAWPALKRFN